MGKWVWGFVIASMVGVAWVVGLVVVKGNDGGRDAREWAWIDVVSPEADG